MRVDAPGRPFVALDQVKCWMLLFHLLLPRSTITLLHTWYYVSAVRIQHRVLMQVCSDDSVDQHTEQKEVHCNHELLVRIDNAQSDYSVVNIALSALPVTYIILVLVISFSLGSTPYIALNSKEYAQPTDKKSAQLSPSARRWNRGSLALGPDLCRLIN
jgi:hypothetical protein